VIAKYDRKKAAPDTTPWSGNKYLPAMIQNSDAFIFGIEPGINAWQITGILGIVVTSGACLAKEQVYDHRSAIKFFNLLSVEEGLIN
tara:strand:+ start:554 stop:814 length:261 start_codon:yes stop_codon:yes gene_type:complete